MGTLEYINEADYNQSNMVTKTTYDCGSCGKNNIFRVLEVAFKTATAKCTGCDAEITVPRGMFYTG